MVKTDFMTVNSQIVADDFDDEMVLIDVQKGLYFSMRGSARVIWKAFKDPQSCSDLQAQLAQHYTDDEVRQLQQAIEKMVEHELLIPCSASKPAAPLAHSFSGLAFVPPAVDVFTDMAELIAIDPVHEVDEAAGWPVRPANFPAQS